MNTSEMRNLLNKVPKEARKSWEEANLPIGSPDLEMLYHESIRAPHAVSMLESKYGSVHRRWLWSMFVYVILIVGCVPIYFAQPKQHTLAEIVVAAVSAAILFVIVLLTGWRIVSKVGTNRDEQIKMIDEADEKFARYRNALGELFPEGNLANRTLFDIKQVRQAGVEAARKVLDARDELARDRQNPTVQQNALTSKGNLLQTYESALARRIVQLIQFGIPRSDKDALEHDAEKIRAHVARS